MSEAAVAVGLRVERALSEGERAEMARALTSVGGQLVSWTAMPRIDRTFALAAGVDAERARALFPGLTVDEPPAVVLRVTPERGAAVERIARALGGVGRPGGTLEVAASDGEIVVVWNAAVAPASLLLDLIDIETSQRRRIDAVLPLRDSVLAELGGSLLRIADLDESRFIETHLAALGPC